MNIFQKSFIGLSFATALITTGAAADDKSNVQKILRPTEQSGL